MRKFILLICVIFFVTINLNAQVDFWTEDFGSGCSSGQQIPSFTSPNGTWVETSTGTNASGANAWFVSAEENGNAAGQCGSGCGNDRSLHLGALNSALGTDLGAAYYEGFAAFCGFFPCGATDKRAESPSINCSGLTDITIEFNYIEGGNAIDNATLWYYNGSTWSQLADMNKTFSGSCSPQGLWTAFTAALPASANNNPNIKIGFRWINNDDGDATDPSFAVDDIVLSHADSGDNTPPIVTCPPSDAQNVGNNCQFICPDFTIQATATDNADPSPLLSQVPAAGTVLAIGTTVISITATDASGNEATCTFEVFVMDETPPTITCPPNANAISTNLIDAAIDMQLPVVSDNCGVDYFENNFNGSSNGDATYPIGTTLVEWTVYDLSGNSSSCTSNVAVSLEPNENCCPGDFNCDGVIGIADLLILVGDFGCLSGCIADLNGDGITGVGDQLIFLNLFGTYCN